MLGKPKATVHKFSTTRQSLGSNWPTFWTAIKSLKNSYKLKYHCMVIHGVFMPLKLHYFRNYSYKLISNILHIKLIDICVYFKATEQK